MTRRVVLWRHGRTSWNVAGRVQGQTDVPLDETGRRQAVTAAAELARLAPDRIVASDLQRAAHTARELSMLTGLEVSHDARLRELNFGIREGLTWPESWERHPEHMRAWVDSDDYRMPGGETYEEVGARFADSLADHLEGIGPHGTLVLVAHGGVLRAGTCTVLGLERRSWRMLGGLDNCAWSILEDVGPHARIRWRLTEWNARTVPGPEMSDDETPGLGSVTSNR